MSVINLGQISAIFVGTAAPSNTTMMWYDDNVGQKVIKYYDTNLATWVAITTVTKTLEQVLVDGNTTSGLDIIISSGDAIQYSSGSGGEIVSASTTALRTWTLPDASGVFIVGGGAATRVAYYGGANTLTSNSNFTFDGTKLSVPTLQMTTGGGATKILFSDASGNASWDVINALTADSSPALGTDYVMTWDASASQHKKVLLTLLSQNIANTNLVWTSARSHDLATYTTTLSNGVWTFDTDVVVNVNGTLNLPNAANDNTLTKLLVQGTAGVVKYRDAASLFGSLSTSVIWVDTNNGSDSTGTGTIYNPYKTIFKGITACPTDGFVYVMPGAYQEPLTKWSSNSFNDNITVYCLPGVSVQGPSRTDSAYGSAFSGNDRFIYRVDQAKKFSFIGDADITGYWGLISTDHSSAEVRIEVSTYKLLGVTGAMNLRFRSGVTKMIVKTGDLVMQDQQGLFIGPGNGSLYLNVLAGDILMYKTNTGWVSNQTRLIQYRSTGNSYIECNNIRSVVDSDHSFTEHLDLIFSDNTGRLTLNLRNGSILSKNTCTDGDYNKYNILAFANEDGAIITNPNGNIYLNGNIDVDLENGVTLLGSGVGQVIVNGRIYSGKSAVTSLGSGMQLKVFGQEIVGSGIFAPAINISSTSTNKIFIDAPVTSEVLVGVSKYPAILYNGSGLTLQKRVYLVGPSGLKSITSEVASRTIKLYNDTPINPDLPASPTSKSLKVTVNKVRDSQTYSITINGTAYTYLSDGTATNLEIAAGLVAAIGTPSGISSVVDNLDGTFTVTATAGTDLTITDSTSWYTQFKWEISRSASEGSPWSVSINGTTFSFSSSDTSYYHETNGGVTDIRDQVKALVQADGVINALIGTYQVDKFGLTFIAASNAVFSSISAGGNAIVIPLITQRPLTVSLVEPGYIGGMTNSISGTSFLYDSDIEHNVALI